MRASDLLTLAFRNLLRRKTRTVLTVLGVVIGTASIMVMMSLGLGMSRQMRKMFSDYGSLTTITVYSFSSKGEAEELTDDVIKKFGQIPHVTGTSPQLSVSVEAKSGAAVGYVSLVGVSQDYLKEIPLKSGRLPKPDDPNLTILYGNRIGETFYIPSKSEGGGYSPSWDMGGGETGSEPLVNPEKDPIFYTFPPPYVPPSAAPVAEGTTQEKPKKKYLFDVAGIVDGGASGYSTYSYEAYCDIDALKAFLRRIYRKSLVPNPKTNKKGKPLGYYVYEQASVFVDDMNHVNEVQKRITDMGFQADSQMQWLEQSQQSMNMVQAVLGGIGAVSLLVAAIGIVNTMMMSIYERTREIGVMKVLGCDMKDIRNLFLFESGSIGFLGGVVGILISMVLSALINFLVSGGGGSGMFYVSDPSEGISYIPLWLYLFSILFAIGIGTAAGYLPSRRAMELSPLAALRNE